MRNNNALLGFIIEPCPYCKQSDFTLIREYGGYIIKCYKCWSSAEHEAKTIREAVKNWNNRS